jgi:uncharacterized membrane protein
MTQSHRAAERTKHDKERVVFFSDAVFAIAITLLAIDIRLPAGTYTEDTLLSQLGQMAPEIFAFALSFAVIALFWLGHFRTFRWIERVSSRLVILNFLFLAFVVLVPFPTSVIAHEGSLVAAVVFYAAYVGVTAFLSTGLWLLARREGLLDPAITSEISRHVVIRSLAVPVLFTVSIPVGILVGPFWAMAVWVVSFFVQVGLARRFHLESSSGVAAAHQGPPG